MRFESFLVIIHSLFPSQNVTLETFLEMVEQGFPKLRAAQNAVGVAAAKTKEKRGAFDPVLMVDTSALRYNSSSTQGKALSAQMLETTVEQTTRSGAKVFAGSRLNFGSVKSPGSSTGELGEYFVGVKLPLLRGNGLNQKSIAEAVANLEFGQATEEARLIRLNVRLKASEAYWEWVASRERKEIAARLLTIAKFRADGIRERFAQGDLPKIDTVESETEVRRREGGLIKAEREIEKALLKLKVYLWNGTLGTPGSLPKPALPSAEEFEAALARAVSERPEVKIIGAETKVIEQNLALAKNDRRPSLDFVISPGIDTGRNSVGATVKAGVFYSVPLRQQTADGQIEQAQEKLEKIRQDEALLKREIETEVQDATSALRRAYERVQANVAELELAQQLELGELIRFLEGDGTLFLLNQRERGTAETAARLVDVIAEFHIAKAALRAAEGGLN